MKKALSLFLSVVLILSSLTLMAGAYTIHYGDYKSGDFYYNILDNGTAEIVRYEGNDMILTIPAELNGTKVSSVGSWFMFDINYEEKVEEIIIENGIKTVGGFGFCENVKKITIPRSVTKIGGLFGGLGKSLETVVGGENVAYCGGNFLEGTPYFKNKDNWTNGMFYFGKCLLGVDKNYEGALKIKNGTISVAYDVFNGCKNLTSVYIPQSVKRLRALTWGGSNFWRCPKLEKITVAKDNKYYSSVNGILFNKSQTILCRYPSAKKGTSYTIPKKVKKIAAVAFEGSKNLTTVTFDKSKKVGVDDFAFLNCKSIKTMTIPKNVYFIAECPGMGLYYYGYFTDYKEVPISLLKGFVLKGYASSETVAEYAAIFNLKFVTLCKNGKAHKTETVKAKKATYFADGYTAYKRCTVCGEKIGYNKVAKPVLKTPKVTVAAGKGTIKVKYNAVKNATGFQVRYIDKNGKRVTKSFTTGKTKTVTLSGIAKGEYKVYVRAFVKSGKQIAYSSWSARSSVTVK